MAGYNVTAGQVHPVYSKEHTEHPSLPLIEQKQKERGGWWAGKETSKHLFALCPMSISELDFILQDLFYKKKK
jgi:hypothetical protein